MELTERTEGEKKAYLDGYSAGEDHMQLGVFRILQKYMNTHGSYMVIQDLLVGIHQAVAMIPVRSNPQIRPHVVAKKAILNREE